MTAGPRPRFYNELTHWWPLFSPPSHYVEEAADLIPDLLSAPDGPPQTLLELGAGGGSLAFHLKPHFRLTLTDLSPGMLDQSRIVNPEAEHVQGDMRTIRLGRTFDLVLLHDAVMYMTTPDDVRAALATAALHCRTGGAVVILPDHVRDSFRPSTEHGGEDATDGRGFRYLAWSWDPDPADDTYDVAYAFLLREADGSVRTELDLHREGLFAEQSWLKWIGDSGFDPTVRSDPFNRRIFIGRRWP